MKTTEIFFIMLETPVCQTGIILPVLCPELSRELIAN
jgi:hypothetical protein